MMRLDIDKLKDKVSKEDLINLYITQNKGVRFCADYFNITIQGFRRLCKEYDIKKTEEQKNKAISTSNSKKETIEKRVEQLKEVKQYERDLEGKDTK